MKSLPLYLFLSRILLVLKSLPAACQSNVFYMDHGSGDPVLVENVDPKKITPKEWQVRLYRKNEAKIGKTYWGLITGKTAENVMEQLKESQDFPKRYAKFFWLRLQKREEYLL